MNQMDNWLVAESVDGEHDYLVHTCAPYIIFEVFYEAQLETWEYSSDHGCILVPVKFISCDPFYTDALAHLAEEASRYLAKSEWLQDVDRLSKFIHPECPKEFKEREDEVLFPCFECECLSAGRDCQTKKTASMCPYTPEWLDGLPKE